MNRKYYFSISILIALTALALFTVNAQAGDQYQDGTIERGKYIVSIAGCVDCHSPYKTEYNKPPQELSLEQVQTLSFDGLAAVDETKLLAGGRPFDLGPAGILFTRNLTPDEATGVGAWTDEQLKLAIKTGIDNEGKVLFPVMPYHVYNGMADADLEAVVAYIRSVKPVSNEIPERTIPTDGMPTPPFKTGITAPDGTDKAARGAYLVNSVMGCTDCHTPVDSATGAPVLEKYLAGKQPYEGPWGIVYGGNITPDKETGIGEWSDDEVKRAILSGVGRDGRRLILMPWYAYASLTAEDADAVVFYLKNVLPAVNNQIPAPSLNPEFNVMAPETQVQTTNSDPLSPALIVLAGIGVILLVSIAGYFLRKKSA